MYYCGIDIAKYKHETTIITKTDTALLGSVPFSHKKEIRRKLPALYERLLFTKDVPLLAINAAVHYRLYFSSLLLKQRDPAKTTASIQSAAPQKLEMQQMKRDHNRFPSALCFDHPSCPQAIATLRQKNRSKRGSPYLQRTIGQAASEAAFCGPALSAYDPVSQTSKKHRLTAASASFRKLCHTYPLRTENHPRHPIPSNRKIIDILSS